MISDSELEAAAKALFVRLGGNANTDARIIRALLERWKAAKGTIEGNEQWIVETEQWLDIMLEVLQEVAAEPYADSDPASLLETLRARARWALGEHNET